VLTLPGTVAVLVPALLVAGDDDARVGWLALAGVPLIALGLALVASTVRLFATLGRGTLAPWDPPTRLVVAGPYRRLRHPMIAGVLCVVSGEAATFATLPLALWALAVLAVNAAYLPLVEEPALVRRFGADYERYMERVPRWLPARRPEAD
jgi:protein-S-isoprenylcysteine O-methyltransferase Ste14